MSEQRVKCIYCFNETAEVTKDGLQCVHPYCKKSWPFDEEVAKRKYIHKTVGRSIVTPPGKSSKSTRSFTRTETSAEKKESKE